MKEELTKKVNEIKDTISNKEEAEKVMNSVSELITMFTDKLLEISERQVKQPAHITLQYPNGFYHLQKR